MARLIFCVNFYQRTQVSRFYKAFANNSSANVTLSKTQLPKIVQSVAFIDRQLGPLIKNGLLLMNNVLKPLTNSSSSIKEFLDGSIIIQVC